MALRLRPCEDQLVRRFADLIENKAVPNNPEFSPAKKFYPINSLREIFSNDQVQSILDHRCAVCKEHLSGDNAASLDRSSADRIMGSDEALSIFALLVWLECPLLIGGFLISHDRSMPLPAHFSRRGLQDRIFAHLPERLREQAVVSFETYKWRFSAPAFEDGSFREYEEGTILPYLEEKRIAHGAFSEVYKVEIHPSYCKLAHCKVSCLSSSPCMSSDNVLAHSKHGFCPQGVPGEGQDWVYQGEEQSGAYSNPAVTASRRDPENIRARRQV
jgi:hypothetical protein